MGENQDYLPRVGVGVYRLLGGLMVLCGLVGGLVHSGAAAADPVPLWSDPITTSSWVVDGAGGREVMYVNELQAGMLDTERVVGPDGAVEYQAETGNTTITPPALAADGSGYVLRGGGTAGVIDAIDTAGKMRWSYTVPADDTVRALLAGSDGAAYVAVSNAIDDEVLRLSPADGSVTFDTPLPDGTYSDGYLFAEPSGVAVITGTHVLFLSQLGQVTADVPAFTGGSATVFTSNDAGDVFVGTAPVAGEVARNLVEL
jgi:outer membrane protein assembly factor BamB